MQGLLLIGLAGLFLYGAWKLLLVIRSRLTMRRARRQAVRVAATQQQRQRQQISQAQVQQQRQHGENVRVINSRYRTLQVALQQIPQAPDFRRAADIAAQCGVVPAPYRRRQFRRFRPLMVRVVSQRLAAGADLETLNRSLTDLVTALAVSDFEAEYIFQEVQARQVDSEEQSSEGFGSRLRKLEREHKSRVAAIEALSAQDASVKQQLLEAENSRFQEEMLGTTDSPALSSDDVSI